MLFLAPYLVNSIHVMRDNVIEKWADENFDVLLAKFGQAKAKEYDSMMKESFMEDVDCQVVGDKQDKMMSEAIMSWAKDNEIAIAWIKSTFGVDFPELSQASSDATLLRFASYYFKLLDIASGRKAG